ncbi:GNAT family N-acetyltransferase [Micromonospora sp. NBC_01796]|uniref:GNAT family N-acetyltransferase n=1 Tax=Micromonospora sp. NBC_01796 TaxID=2975987 RepID=UPI002DDB8BCB|nr:GNAT family N-acetyltransferase [Micromonospora sp. NBC_01796]WSA87519.1 GNAT family N-acetyltransferase [Micromonospora sp. NBC_01796]
MADVKPVEIIEGGLLLRPWNPADASAVHRACQDPDIRRWTTVPAPYLPEHAKGFVGGSAPAAWEAGTGAPFAVCDAATGELLGSCGLVTIDQSLRSGEVGYWTAPWARGRAVAVRATRAVARWAFRDLGLRRVIWQAEVGNHASRLVALRAGFRVEGELRLAQPHPRGGSDGWIGSLLPEDLPEPDTDPTGTGGPAGPGSLVARRAAVFGRPQPVLFATTADGEIRLRRPEERDLDAMVTACRDPWALRWLSLPDPYQRSDAEFFTHRHTALRWGRGDGAVFVIADPEDNFAGTMELRLNGNDPGVADVGYLVAPHARGRGYCPRALAAVCAWGLSSLALARIEWRAHVGNDASRRAAEKVGFVVEGISRQGIPHRGGRVDVWVGALLAEDGVVPGRAGAGTA